MKPTRFFDDGIAIDWRTADVLILQNGDKALDATSVIVTIKVMSVGK
jgi:hypothetical protein